MRVQFVSVPVVTDGKFCGVCEWLRQSKQCTLFLQELQTTGEPLPNGSLRRLRCASCIAATGE